MKKEAMTAINTRYPNDLLDILRVLAKQHQRSLNSEIVWALQDYVSRQRQSRKEETEGDQTTRS
jgi:predicted transcriptional regulator